MLSRGADPYCVAARLRRCGCDACAAARRVSRSARRSWPHARRCWPIWRTSSSGDPRLTTALGGRRRSGAPLLQGRALPPSHPEHVLCAGLTGGVLLSHSLAASPSRSLAMSPCVCHVFPPVGLQPVPPSLSLAFVPFASSEVSVRLVSRLFLCRYGEQDGHAGNQGTVLGVVFFDTESNRGVSVRWDGSTARYLYRWGAQGGKYDIAVVGGDAGVVDRIVSWREVVDGAVGIEIVLDAASVAAKHFEGMVPWHVTDPSVTVSASSKPPPRRRIGRRGGPLKSTRTAAAGAGWEAHAEAAARALSPLEPLLTTLCSRLWGTAAQPSLPRDSAAVSSFAPLLVQQRMVVMGATKALRKPAAPAPQSASTSASAGAADSSRASTEGVEEGKSGAAEVPSPTPAEAWRDRDRVGRGDAADPSAAGASHVLNHPEVAIFLRYADVVFSVASASLDKVLAVAGAGSGADARSRVEAYLKVGCCVVSCRVVSCRVVSFLAVLCRFLLCRAVPCRVASPSCRVEKHAAAVLWRAKQASVVGQLLPHLTAACSLFVSFSPVCVALLPLLVRLVHQLSAVNEFVEASRDYESSRAVCVCCVSVTDSLACMV